MRFMLRSSAPLKLKFPICLNAMTRWLLIFFVRVQHSSAFPWNELSLLLLTYTAQGCDGVSKDCANSKTRAHISKLYLESAPVPFQRPKTWKLGQLATQICPLVWTWVWEVVHFGVSPVMDWRPVQGVPHLWPEVNWDWLQFPNLATLL